VNIFKDYNRRGVFWFLFEPGSQKETEGNPAKSGTPSRQGDRREQMGFQKSSREKYCL
jgi:hypothetical protein